MTGTPAPRKIIHCDCDCFYAAVEMRDDPGLAGHPVAVGGSPDKRGVVATCNYEARRFGVHSAMPMAEALRRCPDLIVVRTNMAKYRAVSSEIHRIFRRYTPLIEPLSLDEAFLDVSRSDAFQGSATRIAQAIRDEVRADLGITLSAGIAPNKFLAKIASDWNKPDGQKTIRPEEVTAFVRTLPVEKLFGVGAVTAARLHKLGIRHCGDLQKLEMRTLLDRFGRFGLRLHELSRGIDERPVKPDRLRKSLSVERTFPQDLPDLDSCTIRLSQLFEELTQRVENAEVGDRIRQMFVKLRFQGFETTTVAAPARTLDPDLGRRLLSTAYQRGRRPVRLLGIGVQLAPPTPVVQFELFSTVGSDNDSALN